VCISWGCIGREALQQCLLDRSTTVPYSGPERQHPPPFGAMYTVPTRAVATPGQRVRLNLASEESQVLHVTICGELPHVGSCQPNDCHNSYETGRGAGPLVAEP